MRYLVSRLTGKKHQILAMEYALDNRYVWVAMLIGRDQMALDYGRDQMFGVGDLKKDRCCYLDEEYTIDSFNQVVYHAGSGLYWIRFLMDAAALEILDAGAEVAVIVSEDSSNDECLFLLEEVDV